MKPVRLRGWPSKGSNFTAVRGGGVNVLFHTSFPAASFPSPNTGPNTHTSPSKRYSSASGMPVEGSGTKLCAACGASPSSNTKLLTCSGCHVARYCSPACQRSHWKVHKPDCKAAAAAAAAAHVPGGPATASSSGRAGATSRPSPTATAAAAAAGPPRYEGLLTQADLERFSRNYVPLTSKEMQAGALAQARGVVYALCNSLREHAGSKMCGRPQPNRYPCRMLRGESLWEEVHTNE